MRHTSWSSNRKYNKFASTVEELLQKIKGADEAGQTAYHACAAFKEARQNPRNTPHGQRRYGRTKHNVRGSKSFWLDVDAGPDKPYLDWKAAALAVAEFCRTTKLPRPVVVLSGLGIYVYWPLVETLDPETWGRYARGLKALCSKYELQADPTRTADITSVLRTPGTHHRKAGIRLVQCGELFGPYALEQFAILLTVETVVREVAPRTSHRGHEFGPLPPYLANRPFEGVGETLRRKSPTIREPSFAHPGALRASPSAAGQQRKSLRALLVRGALACLPLRRTARGWHTNGQKVILVTLQTRRRSALSACDNCPAQRRVVVSTTSTPRFVSVANSGGKNEVADWVGRRRPEPNS